MLCAFVLTGCVRVLMSGAAKNPAATWTFVVLLTPMAALAFAFVLFPARLSLDKTGVSLDMLWKQWTFAWSDFADFEMVPFLRYTRRVIFRLSDRCPDERRRTLIGSTRSFGAMWEIGPDKLCHLLKEAKRKWGS